MNPRLAPVLAGLAAMLVVSACTLPGAPKRTQAQQDADGKTVAGAIGAADSDGSSFHMEEGLSLRGGDIPANRQLALHATADGKVHQGRVQMTYRIVRGNNQPVTYDMVLTEDRVFVRAHGQSGWKQSTAAAATALYPALRLPLLKQSVLLASEVGEGAFTTVGNGFGTRYKITPAGDQMAQLMAIPSSTVFKKTAKAEIDAYLTVTGGRLSRLGLKLQGTDEATREVQDITTTADFRPANVGTIAVPPNATVVDPANLLTLT